MAGIPRTVPDQAALRKCKIISHRGEHDNIAVIENTLAAFDQARYSGVWGIECDIRWTADLVPVVHHDPSGSRLFGHAAPLHTLSFDELRARMPLVPTLAEVIAEFGGNTHLMLELKEAHRLQPALQREILMQQLAPLQPGRDFHLLALDPGLLAQVDFIADCFCFPVSEINTTRLSREALDRRFGGLTGHFLLLNSRVQRRHAEAGQCIGTGFVSSRNCLFRELNRGVEWIFSNDAVKLQRIVEHYLD
jgi:glycerophosphoryl diester phosphodiesterase